MRSEGKRDGASRALRLLGVVCALCAALTVAACGGGGVNNASTQSAEGKPPATPSGTLRVALPGEPQSLDATRTVTAVDMPIMTALYDGLITRMPENFEELSPALATAWKSNSDATEWTFTLRRGVKFSDGADFNAAAAKKTLEFYLRPGTILSFALGPVSKITTPDEFTLVLSYEKPFPDLASYMPLVKMISPKLLAGSVKDARSASPRRPPEQGRTSSTASLRPLESSLTRTRTIGVTARTSRRSSSGRSPRRARATQRSKRATSTSCRAARRGALSPSRAILGSRSRRFRRGRPRCSPCRLSRSLLTTFASGVLSPTRSTPKRSRRRSCSARPLSPGRSCRRAPTDSTDL